MLALPHGKPAPRATLWTTAPAGCWWHIALPSSTLSADNRDTSLYFVCMVFLLLSFAFAIRVQHLDMTLFEDEVWVARLAVSGGLEPHTYNVPPLFYGMERVWVGWRGSGDAALRELPFLFGVLLVALPYFSHRPRRVALVWSALLAFSSPLVFYSARLKQYTLEACSITLLLILFLRAWEEDRPRNWLAFFGCAGALLLVLHTPVFFVLSAGLVTLLTKRTRRAGLLAGFAVAALLFLIAWFGYMAPGPRTPLLHGDMEQWFTEGGRWVDSPRALYANSLHWLGHAFNLVRFWWLVLPLLIGWWLFRKRDWVLVALAGLPIIIVIAASAVHKYPYGEVRLMIFCLPTFYLLAAEALAEASQHTQALLCLLLPFILAGAVLAPYNSYMGLEDLRTVFRTIEAAHRPGEPIYADDSFATPLAWYAPGLRRDLHSRRVTQPAGPGWYLQKTFDLAGRRVGFQLRTKTSVTVRIDD
jgi:hypothetical protein